MLMQNCRRSVKSLKSCLRAGNGGEFDWDADIEDDVGNMLAKGEEINEAEDPEAVSKVAAAFRAVEAAFDDDAHLSRVATLREFMAPLTEKIRIRVSDSPHRPTCSVRNQRSTQAIRKR
jgi:hypothetical protein